MNRIILAVSMLVAAAGCGAAAPGRNARHAGNAVLDARGSTPVHFHRARALISGPALVEHLETEGDGTVALYLADDPGVRDRACPSADAENAAPLAVLGRQSRVTDVVVPQGKRICAAVMDTHAMNVAWKARGADETLSGPFDVAMLAR
jgi:hypothetical protein